MAAEQAMVTVTLVAGAGLAEAGQRFVTMGDDETVVLPAAGALAVGVLTAGAREGAPAAVAIGGIARVAAGEALAAGALVATDDQGQAVAAASTKHRLGVVTIGGTKGATVPVLLLTSGPA